MEKVKILGVYGPEQLEPAINQFIDENPGSRLMQCLGPVMVKIKSNLVGGQNQMTYGFIPMFSIQEAVKNV